MRFLLALVFLSGLIFLNGCRCPNLNPTAGDIFSPNKPKSEKKTEKKQEKKQEPVISVPEPMPESVLIPIEK